MSDSMIFYGDRPDGKSNKIHKANRRIFLLHNLFGRAYDLCQKVRGKIVGSQDGTIVFVDSVYNCEAISVATHIFFEHQKLRNIRRSDNESFRDYEIQFQAQQFKSNVMRGGVEVKDAIAALFLICNSEASFSQLLFYPRCCLAELHRPHLSLNGKQIR